jgi:hypothetical protein
MKTKIPILIAAGLFFATVTKAQYGAPCRDNRIIVQAHIGFPVPVPVVCNYGYNQVPRERYDDRWDGRDGNYARYDDRRDWRAEQYERYCHENRGYRMSREEFYRGHCDNRGNPYYSQRGVDEHRRY